MKQFIVLLVAGLFILPAFAQDSRKKELTLEDAVMKQYRDFYPDALTEFAWIPGTYDYTYIKGYHTLMKASMKDPEGKEWFTIQEVNEILGSELYWFSGFKWKNEFEFWLNNGQKYYLFNVKDKTGRLLVDIENGENPVFHEGTQKVAYTIDNDVYIRSTPEKVSATSLMVRITRNDDPNIVAGQAIARSEFGITGGLFWSPDADKLAYYVKDESMVHDYPVLDIMETPGELRTFKYPMAGQDSEKASVGITDLNSGKRVNIFPQNGAENYLTNLSWTPDNKYVVIAEVNRDQDHMWLNVFDASTGDFVKTLFEETNDRWVEPEHPAFFPQSRSNNFIWISERDGYNNLYLYDFNGNMTKKLTNHQFVVKDILEYKNGRVYYTTTGEDPTETHVYSVDMNGNVQILTRAKGTHSVDISYDAKFFHDHFSSHTVPSADWIINAKGKITKKLMESEDKLAPYEIGTAEISQLESANGTKLYTRLIKPSDFDPNKKYPVLVYVYGGPHAQLITNSWLDGASLWMYWMAEQGYLVYTVDNRGSANRGFAFESEIHRQLGTLEIEDQLLGVEYLKTLPYVDGNRLTVHGWSFGGFMTTSLMLRTPGVFQVGVAGGPVTDWKYYEIMYGERYMDHPDQNEKGYEKASLLNYADKLDGDLLLIHGTIDDVVVMQHNLSLVKKFVDVGKQVDFFPYPMHKHNVRGKDRVHLMEKVLTYIIEHNK